MKIWKIGVDIDDVLFPFSPEFIKFNNMNYGMNWKIENMHAPLFYKAFGISQEEERARLAEFVTSPAFREMKPIKGAVEVVNELKQYGELHNITGRNPKFVKEVTEYQISTHFKDAFKTINYATFSAEGGFKIPKFQLCKDLGIELMIEDIAASAIEISTKCNIPVIMPHYPWNKEANLDGTNVKRVYLGCKGIIEEARRYF